MPASNWATCTPPGWAAPRKGERSLGGRKGTPGTPGSREGTPVYPRIWGAGRGPQAPPQNPSGPTKRRLGDGEEAALAQAGGRRVRGAGAPGGRGAQRARLRGDSVSGGEVWVWPRHGGPPAQPRSPQRPRTRSELLPAARPAAGLLVRERRGGATSGTSRGAALGRAGGASGGAGEERNPPSRGGQQGLTSARS